MKKIFFCFLFYLLFCSACSKNRKSLFFSRKYHKSKSGLKGKVKSVTLFSSSITQPLGKWKESAKRLLHRNKYDIKGNKTEMCSFNSDGTIAKRTTIKIKGNIVEFRLFKPDGTLYYSKNVKINHYHPHGLGPGTKFKYDSEGNVTESSILNPDGTLKVMETLERETKGNVVRYCRYKSGKTLVWEFVYKYKYDKFNSWIKKVQYEIMKKSGKTIIRPVMAYYRTIVYY